MAAVLVKRSVAFVRLLAKISGSTSVKGQIKANHIFVTGFRGAYKGRGLYLREHITGIEKSASKQAIAVLIQTRFALISN